MPVRPAKAYHKGEVFVGVAAVACRSVNNSFSQAMAIKAVR